MASPSRAGPARSSSLASFAPVLAVVPGGSGAPEGAVAEAALIFLVGGLAVLAGIGVLVFLQNLVPQRKALRSSIPERTLRPVAGGQEPEHAIVRKRKSHRPRDVRRPRIDRVMDRIVRSGLGEPRVLRSVGSFTLTRLYGCQTCQRAATGCNSERESIQEAFRSVYGLNVRVRESACRAQGNQECEFEVRH